MLPFKSLCSLLLVISVFFFSIPVSSAEIVSFPAINDVSVRNARVVDTFIAENNLQLSSFDNLEVKIIHDFYGNEYLLGEFEPFGYFIYHFNSGIFVEYSFTSVSPYNGKDGEFLYCGPTEYYIKNNDEVTNLLTDFTMPNVAISSFRNASSQINDSLTKSTNVGNLSYVNGLSNSPISRESSITPRTTTLILHSNYIYQLNLGAEMGLTTSPEGNGLCGYIAAGMMLLYFHRSYPELDLIDNTYLSSLNNYETFKGGDFTLLLRDYGNSDESTAIGIADVVMDYCSDVGCSADISRSLLTSTSQIKGKLQDNLPVAIFGNLYLPYLDEYKNHAVVAYGYTSDDVFVAHFGYPDYTQVYVTSYLPWGSAMAINSIE